MKLALDEILGRVTSLERELNGYRASADAWESMWNLEAFDEDPEAALEDGREQVVLPEPYNVVNLAQRLFPASPRIEVPAETIENTDESDAEQRQRFLVNLWQRSSRTQDANVMSDAVWQGLVLGRGAFYVQWIEDALPKRLKKRRCPILIRTLDPRNVGVKRGPLYTLYAFHKYSEQRSAAMTRYPDLDWDQEYEEADNLADEVEIVDFWYTNPKDGSVWNAIIIDGKFAEEPEETEYLDIPIVEFGSDRAPVADETRKYHGILHSLDGTWQYQCRLASQIATGLLWYFWPAIITRSKTGQAPPDLEIGPGKTTPVTDDIEIDPLQLSPNVPMAENMMNMLQTHNQQGTFPGVMYGQAPGQIQAGFAVSILADAASGRINSLRQSLELAMQTVNEIALGMVETFSDEDGVAIWGKDEASDQILTVVLTPEQVSGFYDNIVTLKPQIPSDEFQRQAQGMQLVLNNIISRQTYRDKYADIELPTNEEKRVLWEQAAFGEGSPLAELLRDMAVEEKMGMQDWKTRVVAYQMMEAQKIEELKQSIMAASAPPAPPAPPAAPPGPPMLPPGAPPPGGPPARQTGDLPAGSLQLEQAAPMSPLPPEMQGQISPEMLGISPDMPPELFQMMMNQYAPPGAVPTMDDVRALGNG